MIDNINLLDVLNPADFIGQAVWALLALSLLTAPMGCFMVWRKLSYFGATLAHSAILGAILGLLTGVGVLAGVIGFTTVLALGLSFYLNNRLLSGDTVLGIIAHISLAAGVIAVSVMDNLRIDLMVYLFGDVFSISTQLFYIMLGIAVIGAVLTALLWRGFVNLTLQSDIARVEGYPVVGLEIVFTLVLSITIALGMLSIGLLLIIALLIIPAASARLLARSLGQMVLIAWIMSVLCIIVGMCFAVLANLPAGPAIVITAGFIFLLTHAITWIHR